MITFFEKKVTAAWVPPRGVLTFTTAWMQAVVQCCYVAMPEAYVTTLQIDMARAFKRKLKGLQNFALSKLEVKNALRIQREIFHLLTYQKFFAWDVHAKHFFQTFNFDRPQFFSPLCHDNEFHNRTNGMPVFY